MTSTKGVPWFLLLILGIVYNVDAILRSCTIPRGGQYGSSVYRPQYGSSTYRYPPGRRLNHGTKIVIICKKELYQNSALSKCQDGSWVPALPDCKDDTGNERERIQDIPVVQPLTDNKTSCDKMHIANGKVVGQRDNDYYDVTCNPGFHLSRAVPYMCREGQWAELAPHCVPSEQNCTIPRMARFRRTLYRPQSGSSTSNYPAGSVISPGSTVVAICKKDIYGDVITDWTFSKCKRGKWVPKLPSCKAKKRCRAPTSIQHATASERITPYITFPHGTTVTYTCDVGKMATGIDTIVCNDGKWSETNFQCEDNPDYKSDTTPALSTDTQRGGCSQLTIENGNISVKDVANNTYTVTCGTGFRSKSSRSYRCRGGKWIGVKPECVRAAAQCKFSLRTRRQSELKSNATGEVINAMYIDHWTQAVQTCRGKSRNAQSKTVRCVNGRWRPSLMICRQTSTGNGRTTSANRRQKRSNSDCVIPNVRGGEAKYHDVISGVRDAFVAGDVVQHGQRVQRECLEGIMLLPVIQFNTTMITECDNGKWNPSIQRCLRDERDTVFFDGVIDDTTTQTPVSTLQPDTQYRIHIQDSDENSPVYVFLNGTLQTGVVLQLTDPMSVYYDLRQYEVTAANIGEITRIRVSYSSELGDSDDSLDSLTFVSIYKEDSRGFYIERFTGNGDDVPTPIRGRPCKRCFERMLHKRPADWSENPPEYQNIRDEVECQLKCIEETPNCQIAYYSSEYESCAIFENPDLPLGHTDKQSLSLFRRMDNC